jgi:hypothetical protein|uniref:Uncharacterized protein n=1 Tax=viral metagenome TaxID=1070528 RepID=A0A6C0IDQ4_9ZZZZ
MVEYIYYNGKGSNKKGKYTVTEFLNIMNKYHKNECADFFDYKDNYKPCVEYREMDKKDLENEKKNNKPMFSTVRNKKEQKKYTDLLYKCYGKTKKQREEAKIRRRKNFHCNLDEYITYSEAGKTKNPSCKKTRKLKNKVK